MFTIQAQIRLKRGKSFSRQLRLKNQFPGIIYGLNIKSIPITLDHNTVFNLQKKIDFYKKSLLILINNEKYIVKVQEIQRHSFKLQLLHIDFFYIKN